MDYVSLEKTDSKLRQLIKVHDVQMKNERLVRLFDKALETSHLSGDLINVELYKDALEVVASDENEKHYQEIVTLLTALSYAPFVEITFISEVSSSKKILNPISIDEAFKKYLEDDWKDQRTEELVEEFLENAEDTYDDLPRQVYQDIENQVKEELKTIDKGMLLTEYIDKVQPYLVYNNSNLTDLYNLYTIL